MNIARRTSFKAVRLSGGENLSRLFVIFLAMLLLIVAHAPRRAYAQQTRLQIASIEFNGLRRVTREQAIAASGLQVGKQIELAALNEASQKLIDSGLFTRLSYRVRGTSASATVVFEVEEAKGGGFPVVFDNFVWFTDEELTAAVRREVPNFDGTATESSGVIQSITRALQQLLKERKIQGEVYYNPSANLAGRNTRHVFSVTGAATKICAVRFPGSAGVSESELAKKARELLETEYSQEFVSAFAGASLIPVYRHHGHLRAQFGRPSAKLDAASCQEGVTVMIPVTEGVSYLWDKAEWSGNEAYEGRELVGPLGMKPGEVADGLKIDEGLKAVEKLYGRKGYLDARVRPEPVFDDENRRVTYRISVKEGPQYRMGTLTVKGLPEEDEAIFKERWKLRQGDAYDAAYLNEFLKQEAGVIIETAMRAKRIDRNARLKIATEIKPNPDARNVEVIVQFRNEQLP